MRFASSASVAVLLFACGTEPDPLVGSPNNQPPGTTPGTTADGGTVPTGDGGTTPVEAGPPPKPSATNITITGTQPSTGDGKLQVESVDAENAGGAQSDRIRVTIIGNTGQKRHKILIYFFADNGQLSSVTHQWADSLNDVFQADGIAYCDALGHDQPVCVGMYHDFQQRFITLTNTILKGKFPGNEPTASTINGAVLLPQY
jgi:hypothetical protein